jgi:hypothetical protein
MSRDTNFGGSYLVLIKAAIIARCFWGMKAGSDWDSCLPWQPPLAPQELGRGEALSVGPAASGVNSPLVGAACPRRGW